jgi:hypothetical protein
LKGWSNAHWQNFIRRSIISAEEFKGNSSSQISNNAGWRHSLSCRAARLAQYSCMAIRFRHLANRYRVARGVKFHLQQFPSGDTWHLKKEAGQELLAQTLERLTELQGKLYAQNNYSLLLIFQAMDAAGKDSTIKHVMSGLNPQGCEVYSFKAPSDEELDHDFLWRAHRRLPERGRIGIFNRSYYEEVLVVRVHCWKSRNSRRPPPAKKSGASDSRILAPLNVT